MLRLALLASLAVASLPVRAHADEGLIPLAESGDWYAYAHHTSMIAAPDLCMVTYPPQGFALRSDEDGLELRVIDEKWTLPTNVDGSIVVGIGSWTGNVKIAYNTNDMISAKIEGDFSTKLFEEMDKASSMKVTVGKSVFDISLSGSTKATNAFRTCAGLKSGSSAGSNPFE